MITLRNQGWTFEDLGILFNCNKTSVRKACIQNGIAHKIKLIHIPTITFKGIRVDYNGERMSPLKSYKEILSEQMKRQQKRTLEGGNIKKYETIQGCEDDA
jgi:hypothetical protein